MNYRPKLRSADTEGGAQPSAASAWVLALCYLLSLGSPTLAQPPDEPVEDAPTGDFFEVVNVEIANIDVWVTDKEGNPVVGDHQVEVTVEIDVDGCSAKACEGSAGSRQPHADRLVFEARSEPEVAIEGVGLSRDVCQDQIFVVVAVEVPRDGAHRGLG